MRPFHFSAFFVGQLLLSAGCAAQGQTPPSEPQPAIHTGANLVIVDVVVTDHGQPVRGLDRSAFHVFEDGKEQPLSSFDENRPSHAAPVITRPTLPPNTYSNRPVWPDSSAVNVLLLDALNTPLSDQGNVRQRMIQYLGNIKPGTTMAIFSLSSGLRLITDFTTDPAALVAALKRSKANPRQSALLASEQSDGLTADGVNVQQTSPLTGDSAASSAPNIGILASNPSPLIDSVAALKQFQADQIASQTDVRVKITLAAMQELAGYLSGIPGRKNVIWFSGGFPLVTFPDSSLFHSFANVSTYSDEIQRTSTLLAAARVAIYPVDSQGLMVSSQFSSSKGYTAALDQSLSAQFRNEGEERNSEQSTMQQVADETGGRAFIDTNDFDQAVADAVDNGSTYYAIAYVPPSEHFDGKFHKIEVRLDSGRKLSLAYRRGYYADARGKPSAGSNPQAGALATALAPDAPVSTGVLLTARVLPAADPIFKGVSLPVPAAQSSISIKGPVHRYIVDLVIDTHGLALATTPEGDLKTAIELALVAYAPDGRQINSFAHGYQIGIKAAQSARVMASGLPLRIPFDLPSGNVTLRIGLRDLNADRTGSLHIPLRVPE
ncbi:MAG TPA: VWA domain-containing protein [Terracidiphilus sp.]|nr:VWA domain-containing protein [Terracidiphilus sp.]